MRSAANLKMVRGLVPAETVLSGERTLPVDDGLTSVVPSGCLQRGTTVAVHGTGATSFTLALVGQAVRDGSFLAIVAPESFGLAACLDFDIPLRRVVQFALGGAGEPNGHDHSKWAQAVAAIVEGFDMVVLADRRRVGSSQARQLTARNRERGSVLLRVGGPSWPDAADLRFDVTAPAWTGLGQGHGHLRERRVSVQVAGRRFHGRARSHELMLPARAGGVTRATPAVAVMPSVGERFAGADIDAMLDVVDGVAERDGVAAADAGETTGGAVDLDATA